MSLVVVKRMPYLSLEVGGGQLVIHVQTIGRQFQDSILRLHPQMESLNCLHRVWTGITEPPPPSNDRYIPFLDSNRLFPLLKTLLRNASARFVDFALAIFFHEPWVEIPSLELSAFSIFSIEWSVDIATSLRHLSSS